jgi:hypothetical protein
VTSLIVLFAAGAGWCLHGWWQTRRSLSISALDRIHEEAAEHALANRIADRVMARMSRESMSQAGDTLAIGR